MDCTHIAVTNPTHFLLILEYLGSNIVHNPKQNPLPEKPPPQPTNNRLQLSLLFPFPQTTHPLTPSPMTSWHERETSAFSEQKHTTVLSVLSLSLKTCCQTRLVTNSLGTTYTALERLEGGNKKAWETPTIKVG